MLFDARKLWVLCVVVVEALSLQWAPESPALSSVVYACVNGTISLPWAVSKTTQENIVNIEWYFRGQSEEMIAIYSHGHFNPLPSFSGGRAEFLSNAGLTIHDVTAANKGHYSVDINGVDASGSFIKLSREVTVEVEDHLPTTDGHLHVQEDSLTQYDVTTDQNHLVLKCGHFTHQPPFEVEWQTPSGHVFNSSTYKDGYFQLIVPNPVIGGQYTCRPPANTPCIQSGEVAPVTVDETLSRMKVLEADNKRLQADNKRLQSTNNKLSLSASGQCLADKRVMFAARLTANATQTFHHPLIYSDVIINEGGAYNLSTGMFTVPHDGLYYHSAFTSLKEGSLIPSEFRIQFNMYGVSSCYTFFGNPVCSNIDPFRVGQRLGVELTANSNTVYDLDLLNLTDTYFNVYYISPCLTDDFLIFGANVTAHTRITDAMVFMDRFNAFNSSAQGFTIPFDGVFYFYTGSRTAKNSIFEYKAGELHSYNVYGYVIDINVTTVHYVSSCLPDKTLQIPFVHALSF